MLCVSVVYSLLSSIPCCGHTACLFFHRRTSGLFSVLGCKINKCEHSSTGFCVNVSSFLWDKCSGIQLLSCNCKIIFFHQITHVFYIGSLIWTMNIKYHTLMKYSIYLFGFFCFVLFLFFDHPLAYGVPGPGIRPSLGFDLHYSWDNT